VTEFGVHYLSSVTYEKCPLPLGANRSTYPYLQIYNIPPDGLDKTFALIQKFTPEGKV